MQQTLGGPGSYDRLGRLNHPGEQEWITAKLNDWLTVVTNIGVIAGLVLLAYEIAQTNETMKREAAAFQVSSLTSINAMWNQFHGWIIENEDATELWIKGGTEKSLTPSEDLRYGQMAEQLFFSAWNQRQIDMVRFPGTDTYLTGARLLSPYLRDYPGLRPQFDRWAKILPTVGERMAADLEEVERASVP